MLHTLEQYVAQYNSWNRIFDKSHVDININNITKDQAHSLVMRLDNEMSPENLHCDGEITHAQAMKKYNFLTTVLDELNIYCDANGLTRPRVYEA